MQGSKARNDTRGEEILTAYSYIYDESGNITAISGTGTTSAKEGIGGALTFAKNFYNIGQTGIRMYCKYGILGESLGLDTAGKGRFRTKRPAYRQLSLKQVV